MQFLLTQGIDKNWCPLSAVWSYPFTGFHADKLKRTPEADNTSKKYEEIDSGPYYHNSRNIWCLSQNFPDHENA